MAIIFSTQLLSYVAPVTRTTSVLFGFAFVITGVLGIANPSKMAENFGIAVPEQSEAPSGQAPSDARPAPSPSPWIRVVAVRNLSLGLLNLALARRGDWQVAGLLYLACMPIAAVDGWAVWTEGVRQKHVPHTLGVPVLALIGFVLAST